VVQRLYGDDGGNASGILTSNDDWRRAKWTAERTERLELSLLFDER